MDVDESTGAFGNWKYSHYFQFVAHKGKNISVKCKICPGDKLLSTAVLSMSNLSKHLTRQHSHTKLVAKECHDGRSHGDETVPRPPKQAKLVGSQQQVTSQGEIL